MEVRPFGLWPSSLSPDDLAAYVKTQVAQRLEKGETMTEEQIEGRAAAEAMTKIAVGEEVFQTAGEGNGPVAALDESIRRGLRQAYR